MIIAIAGRRGETAGLLVSAALGASARRHTVTTLPMTTGNPDVVVVLDAAPSSAALLAPVLDSLPSSALVVGYADDAAVAARTASLGTRIVRVGLSPESDLHASDIDTSLAGTTFTAHTADGSAVAVRTAIVGESVVPLVLAAVAVAVECGVDATTAAEAIVDVAPAPFDMRVSHLAPSVVLIDDTLDATPASVSAALKALAQATTDGTTSVAVLGELDLDGETDFQEVREAHDRIGRLVVRLNVSQLVVVGQSARHIHNAAGLEGSWDGESVLVDTVEEAYAVLGETVLRSGGPPGGAVVLLKPSATADLRSLGNRIGTINA
ncbi:MAG: UDP-N-acetylmuramoyl-tripeptide--D-alanyl-D-alanine ligase [Microbacteriaceae bacterium]|nr:UDP-N-acetylmuramoyl-tripeptide--D-alanyl-D-alanine ligase [Microbacteriaceae bacterium]